MLRKGIIKFAGMGYQLRNHVRPVTARFETIKRQVIERLESRVSIKVDSAANRNDRNIARLKRPCGEQEFLRIQAGDSCVSQTIQNHPLTKDVRLKSR